MWIVLTNHRFFWPLLALTLLLAGATVTWYFQRQAAAEKPVAVARATTIPVASPAPATSAALSSTHSVTMAVTSPDVAAAVSPAQAATVRSQPDAIFVEAVDVDADTFNPLLTTNPTGLAVARQLFPTLLGQEPQTGLVTPTALAERWAVDTTGRVYTFTLRTDMVWSDGQPVTALDVQYSYAAMVDERVQSPYRANLSAIAQLITPDQQTVVITLSVADCAALHLLRHPLLPSHRYAVDFSDVRTNPLNTTPTVSAGPLLFRAHTPGVAIRLQANPAYWRGPLRFAGYTYRIVADPAERLGLLVRGEVDLAPVAAGVAPQSVPTLAFAHLPADRYTFLAFNLADPQTPQPGLDGNGQPVAQPPHPILGELAVRQALALALDRRVLLQPIGEGEAIYLLEGYLHPTVPWAYEPLPAAPTDPLAAAQLLTASGWTDSDGDGVRERAGEPLGLTLITNDDSLARLRIAELVRAQLAAIGVAVTVQPLPFELLTAQLLGQQFDLVVAGWDNLGPDPGTSTFWHRREDRPGSGLNFASLPDPEVDGWLDQAATVPGCAPAVRGELYRRVQRRVQAAVVYPLIGGPVITWAYNPQWQQLRPAPWGTDANLHEWWKVERQP
jgi:peptide/nickel transport system substrate-binding protein